MKGLREERYVMRLANGRGWDIIARGELRSWVEKLATIMQLKQGDPEGYPRLIFTRKRLGIDSHGQTRGQIAGDLPRSGWMVHDLRSLEFWSHPDVPDVICEMGDEEDHDLSIVRMWISLSPVYMQALESGGLPLHAALVERKGHGVLLPAPGGTGKSTCCRRIPHPWKALCDDLTLIVVDTDKQYRVHPFPTWSNYLWKTSAATWDVQRHLPLSALFFLEQGRTDDVIPLGRGQASVFITESAIQVYQSISTNLLRDEERTLKEKIFRNACELARTIPAFRLRVSMQGQFWKEMERVPR